MIISFYIRPIHLSTYTIMLQVNQFHTTNGLSYSLQQAYITLS